MSSQTSALVRSCTAISLLALVLPPVAVGQNTVAATRYAPWTGEPANSAAILRDLRALIDQAERDRAANPDFLADLRGMADRHDVPVRRALLADRFTDGDYLCDPAWTVARGKFFVESGYGMRSIVLPPALTTPPADGGGQQQATKQILGAILQQVVESGMDVGTAASAKSEDSDALIYTRLRADNGFALEMEFLTGKEIGTLEVGIFQGAAPGPGYRLALSPGGRPSLVLSRVEARGSVVIDTAIRQLRLEPGKHHRLLWTRGSQGVMTVTVDDQQFMRDSDRTFLDPWDGVLLRNGGGDFTVRQITLRAAP